MNTFKVSIIAVLFFSFSSLSLANNSPWFEYELYVQAESSLNAGPFNIQGKIVNTGTVDITQWWTGVSYANNTGDVIDVMGISSFSSVRAGETVYFSWVTGTYANDSSAYAGRTMMGEAGFLPAGSDWSWTSGGWFPELAISSTYVNGLANDLLPWNKFVYNLNTVGQYINTPTPLASVPEPSSILLMIIGLAGLRLTKKLF